MKPHQSFNYHFYFILLLSIGTLYSVSAQDWMNNLPDEKIDNKNLNFKDFQQAFYQTYPKGIVKGGVIDYGSGNQKLTEWKLFKRWEWFMESRVDKQSGKFPNKSAAQVVGEYNQQNIQTRSAINGGGSWSSPGPSSSWSGYYGTGRLNCVAFHPSDVNTFWVGSPGGGLWKTTDGGTNWTVSTDDNDVLGVSTVALHPEFANNNTLFIGTGDRDGGSLWSVGGGQSNDNNGIGILKSTNGGVSWSNTGLTFTTNQKVTVNEILINPSNGDEMFAATSSGIYKSTDGGDNWVIKKSSFDFVDMDLKPGSPSVIYASTTGWGTQKIFKSSDAGENWSEVLSLDGRRIQLAVSPNNSNVVYALAANSSRGLKGVYKSTNSGDSFSVVFAGSDDATLANNVNHGLLNYYCDGSVDNSGQGSYDLCLAADPNNANIVFIGGVNTWKSIDGGVSWSNSNMWTGSGTYNSCGSPVVHADKHYLVFQNSTSILFECNDGGVYKTADGGSTWTDLTGNMMTSQMYKLGVSATDDNHLLTGLQDNGTKRLNNSTWSNATGGDGMECIIDYQDPSIQYGCIQNGKLRRTTNNWINSTVITDNGILDGLEGAWVTPYVLDPNNPQVIYLGFQELYKSTDRGDTWTQLTNLSITNEIRSIVIAPSNNQVIYMSDFDKLWKTTDGGASWSEITNSLPSLSNNNITYIAVKDNDPNTIWITLGGYNNKKVYQSSDGGSSWLDISGGLPSIPVMTIVQNKQNTVEVELYTGTDVGVYQKIGDNNWTAFCTDLPNVVVTELEIFYDQNNSDNSKLWAATFGRGLWSTPLPSLFSAQNPSSFSASAVSQTQIDLSWNINANSDNVILAYASDETFGTPINGTTYNEGDNIPGGGTLVYLGNASSFSHTTLNSNTPYYYKIWSFDGNEYSSGLITNATTPCGDITSFPYLEGFESGEVPPNCWTSFRGANNEGDQVDWTINNTNVKTGTYSAYLRYEDVANVAEDWLVSPKLAIPNSSSASLSYWERDGGYGQQYTSTYKIKVSTSSPTDHASFTDLSTYAETDLTSTYTQNTIDLSAYIGQEIYVAFVVAQDDGEDWYLDDIKFEVIENSNCTTTYGVDTQIACDSYNWIDGNTYTSNVTPTLNTNHLVETEGMTFSPSSINIIVGDTVTFVNTGGSHNVNGTTASFPNNPESFGNTVGAGWTFTHVFNTAGNYDYWCDPHAPSMAGTISVSNSNNITHTLTNSEGCDSVVTLDLTINSSPIINIGNDTTICDNASITLDAGGGFTTYQWSDGSSNQNISVSTSGTYSITVTDNNNCNSSSIIVISTINCNANCDAPTNLNVSNVTTNSANLSWVAGGAETVWELTWGNQGFNTGAGTLVPMLTNDSYNLTGLSANTSYDFYVKADCGFPSGTTDLSSWSGPFSFATSSAVGDDFTGLTDQNFEQSLIDLGYDDIIDGQVLTSNISNVSYLDVNNQDISSLEGIEAFTSLITLICNNNSLTSLDVTQNAALENINCRYNQISTLDVSQNTALISLICNDNVLNSLDVRQNIALEHLGCEDNELTSIDVSMNTSLIYFVCGDNQIATLDVSNNTALTYLGCHANQLTTLDVSQNTALTVLSFGENQLTSIDVSNLSALTRFWCYGNALTCVNLKNGNNTNISSFDATGNSSLNCIEVDNPTWAEANWTHLNLNVDNGVTFSTSCSYPAGCF